MSSNALGLRLSVLVFIGWFMASCNGDRVFDQYKAIDDHQWAYTDTLTYTVPIQDTAANLSLAVNFRNKVNYPYRNIWLLLRHRAPSGEISAVKAEFELAEKSGKWKGQGLGDLYDHRFPVQKQLQLNERGKHRFEVIHLMRRDTLPGIMDLGLQIVRAKR